MKRLINILLNQSLVDLFKHKSFFLLIFVLILADRLIKFVTKSNRSSIELPEFNTLSNQIAEYVFNDLPGILLDWATDFRTLLVAVLLFFLKQLISMWPSSDMRRMHRREREKFGLIASLVSIHGKQVVWDAIAVGSIVAVTGAWILAAFGLSLFSWRLNQSVSSLFIFGTLSALIFPLSMAGFSFSSKLAVISKGSFSEKLKLYFQLFLNRRVLAGAWLFFLFRIAIEAVFVVILPLLILWTMDQAILRIALAGLIATPFYSFLKMASFKFFLFIYESYPLVKEEYEIYYQTDAS